VSDQGFSLISFTGLPPHSGDLTKNEFPFSYVGLGTLSDYPPMNPMRHLLPGACALFLLFCPANAHALDYVDTPGPYPHGITTDGTNLWIADYDLRIIVKLNGDGEEINSYPFPSGSPRGIAYAAGDLFVATGSRVYRINAETGSSIANFPSPDPIPNHQGLAHGGGKVWIASKSTEAPWIYGVDPATGQSIVDFAAPGPNPRGLTYHDGSLWNLDSTDNMLYELSPADGSILASYPIPLGDPRGLTYFEGRFLQVDKLVDLIMSFDTTNSFSDVYVARSRYTVPGSQMWLPFIASHSIEKLNHQIRRILFFQHGIGDNAVDYFARARYAARLAGRVEETLIVSFQLIDDNKLQSAPPPGMLYWTGGARFWGGLSAGATAPYPRGERFSSFALLDTLLTSLTITESLLPNLESIVVSGHSGGGQFANRYAATSPFERTMLPGGRNISVSYIVMNPSNYLYFNERRFDPLTLDLEAGVVDFIDPSPPSAGHNDYGYGLDDLYSYPSSVGIASIVSQYPCRKVIYLAGEADIGDGNLDTTTRGTLQGTNRYERALIYYEHLKDNFGVANLPRHRLATVPGVGHNSFAMVTSDKGLWHHFHAPMTQAAYDTAVAAARTEGRGDVTSDPASYNLVTQASYDAVAAERDARPTAGQLAAVEAERDARFTEGQIRAMSADYTIGLNEAGNVQMKFNLFESADLNTFAPFTVNPESLSVVDGSICLEFARADNAAFFRFSVQ